MLTVKTNNHLRELKSWMDLDPMDQMDFTYVEGDERYTERFVKYRGEWYDVCDAQVISRHAGMGDFPVQPGHPLEGWDCVVTETMWSGVVFRFPTEEEAFRYDVQAYRYAYVIVGRYCE